MSSIINVLLLLAVAACMSEAQFPGTGQQCLCQGLSTRQVFSSRSEIKDIQIYPSTIFCDKVEIVVTLKDSFRFCLDPKGKIVKRLVSNIIRKKRNTSTVLPKTTPTQGSTNTPRI